MCAHCGAPLRVALAPEDGTVPLWVFVSTVCTHLQRVRGLVSRRCPWARRVGASAACGCPAGGVRHPPRLPATHVACRDECGVPCPLSVGNPREWTLDPSLVDVRSPPSPARGECRGGACSLRRTPSGSVVESVPRVPHARGSEAPWNGLVVLAACSESLAFAFWVARCPGVGVRVQESMPGRATSRLTAPLRSVAGAFVRSRATWLILPVVICLSQRLSHACLSISDYTVKLRMAH